METGRGKNLQAPQEERTYNGGKKNFPARQKTRKAVTNVTLSAKTIKAEALSLGFNACGVSPARPVAAGHCARLAQFVADGEQGDMGYLARNTDVRSDPRRLVEGARSVVSVALGYYPSRQLPYEASRLAFYAYGKDYHTVVKERLQELLKRLLKAHKAAGGDESTFSGRAFCDTAPLPERYWAYRSGLGWIGRNTQLILPGLGSYFFLGELVITSPVDVYDRPMRSRCGRCRRCLDACPVHALSASRHLVARRCLSYLSIEHRGPLPSSASKTMGHMIYGCDRCQLCCPHNSLPRPTAVPEFAPSEELCRMTDSRWLNLSHDEWCSLFRGSAVRRVGYEGFMRNVRAVLGKKEGGGEKEEPKKTE